MNLSNPFLITGYISPEYFCDREAETQQLISSALNPKNTALFSLRRLGKTALMMHTNNVLKKKGIKCLYIDIMMTKSKRDFEYQFSKAYFNQTAKASEKVLNLAGKLLKSFTPSLSMDNYTGNVSLDLKAAESDSVEQDMENIFEHIKNSGDKYFIAIDEFQQILDYPEKNFEAFLRSKIQFINNASFVFLGSKKHLLLSIFGDYSRPFWQSCNFMELKSIDREKYFEFIIDKFVAVNRSIDLATLNFIYNTSRGITYYIQLLCNYLYNLNINRIDYQTTVNALNEIIDEKESYYINLSEILTDRQISLLTALAIENGFDKPTSGDFITSHKLGSASTVKSAMDNLINKEMIYRENETYYVADVLFALWLKRNHRF